MAGIRDIDLIDSVVTKGRSVAPQEMATADVCAPVLAFAIDRYRCLLADVWSVDPRQGNLILIASKYGKNQPSKRINVLPMDGCLTGHAVETKRITIFDLDEIRTDGRRFKDVGLRESLGVDFMLSVPVLNTANPHQVLCVLNFYPDKNTPLGPRQIQRLKAISTILAASIEGSLRERAYRMSMMLGQQLAERDEDVDRLTTSVACEILATCCLKALRASRVAIYLKDPVDDLLKLKRVELAGSPHSHATQNANDETDVPLRVQQVLKSNREFLVPQFSDRHKPGEFFESPTSDMRGATCILVPLQDLRGECQGVVHCARYAKGSVSTRFCYDDIAILEAMSQAFIPPLETLLEAERRRFSQQKLSHELRVPVGAFRTVLTKMHKECQEQDFSFKYPHFNEAAIYTDLMIRLLEELDIARFGPSEIPLKIRPTHVEADVVIPALRFTIPLLRVRKMFARQFEYSGFKDFPKLEVDAALITQVVFNLLDNAIKYYDGPKQDFCCKVEGVVTEEFFEIVVSDNGPGVDETDVSRIFKYGERGRHRRANAFGEGLGLWISKGIAQRHEGDLVVDREGKWTTFTLRLPKKLASKRKSSKFTQIREL